MYGMTVQTLKYELAEQLRHLLLPKVEALDMANEPDGVTVTFTVKELFDSINKKLDTVLAESANTSLRISRIEDEQKTLSILKDKAASDKRWKMGMVSAVILNTLMILLG